MLLWVVYHVVIQSSCLLTMSCNLLCADFSTWSELSDDTNTQECNWYNTCNSLSIYVVNNSDRLLNSLMAMFFWCCPFEENPNWFWNYFIDLDRCIKKKTHTHTIFLGVVEGCITTSLLWDMILSHRCEHVTTLSNNNSVSANRFPIKSIYGSNKIKDKLIYECVGFQYHAMISIRLCTVWYVLVQMHAEYYCWVKTC